MRKAIIALLVGFLFACEGTHITYSCPPIDGDAGCVLFAKAVSQPRDLLHNKQSSLVHFSENFVEAFLVIFAIFNVPLLIKKRGKRGEV